MPAGASPADQIHTSIDELFADADLDLAAVMEDVAGLSVWLVFQAAPEVEVTELLGRDRYARGDRARNGYSDVTIKTTAGPNELERPKVRGTLDAFASRLRGRSMRDIQASLAETLGPDSTVRRSTRVSTASSRRSRSAACQASKSPTCRSTRRCSATYAVALHRGSDATHEAFEGLGRARGAERGCRGRCTRGRR